MSVNPDTSDIDFPAAPRIDQLETPPASTGNSTGPHVAITPQDVSTGSVVPEKVTPPQESVSDVNVDGAAVVPEPDRSIEDRILDTPSKSIKLQDGLEVEIRPLKLREFLKLLKVITRGGASIMGSMRLDFNDTETFMQELLAIILFAVPEAEDEVVEFLEAIVKPDGLTGDFKQDEPLLKELVAAFDNPEMEDVIDIITLLVRTEGKDLQALGKRLKAMFEVSQKMGATKPVNP